MNRLLKKIPTPLKGKIVERKEACRMCDSKSGDKIGEVDFWDIKNSDIVKCEKCGLMQLDPMLTQEETAKGCFAYYIEESLRTSPKDQGKNLLRNFRRGFLFGMSLKRKKIIPQQILELGPGSGYFSEGVKFVFPNANVTVMDVNKEVLLINKRTHQFNTIESIPETYDPELENKFDLIIARDIIEHVIDIGKVIKNVKAYLKNQGIFHFITPNGHEDVWKHYLTYNELNKKSELLINHVNYFDGKGLLDYLERNDFSSLEYYTYKLKTTRRGRGWKVDTKLMAPVSQQKNSSFYIEKEFEKVSQENFDKKDVLNKWYIHKNRKLATYFLSWYHHANLITLAPELNVGHEIYGLFRVTKK
ncbi:MAG: class I SAM-dependent methyltransferase [Vicingus serpentipes]|nr:class I SAM-dependent methyltransferase [Vicingus serpentipes]